jgi:hypothetical protein
MEFREALTSLMYELMAHPEPLSQIAFTLSAVLEMIKAQILAFLWQYPVLK